MGQITISGFNQISVGGNYKLYSVDCIMSNSYANYGDLLDISSLPINNTETINFIFVNDTGTNYILKNSGPKIVAYTLTPMVAQVTPGTDLSSVGFNLLIYTK